MLPRLIISWSNHYLSLDEILLLDHLSQEQLPVVRDHPAIGAFLAHHILNLFTDLMESLLVGFSVDCMALAD